MLIPGMEGRAMHEGVPTLQWTVAEVVTQCPQAAAVFTCLRMACIGCAMAPFETLAEAATAYRLEPETVLRHFRKASHARGRRGPESAHGRTMRSRTGEPT